MGKMSAHHLWPLVFKGIFRADTACWVDAEQPAQNANASAVLQRAALGFSVRGSAPVAVLSWPWPGRKSLMKSVVEVSTLPVLPAQVLGGPPPQEAGLDAHLAKQVGRVQSAAAAAQPARTHTCWAHPSRAAARVQAGAPGVPHTVERVRLCLRSPPCLIGRMPELVRGQRAIIPLWR